MNLKTKNIFGQSMFELILAIGIAAFVLTALVSLSTVSVRNTTSSKDNALANRYAQEAIEYIRSERDTVAWAGFIGTRSNRTWCMSSSPPSWGASGVCGGTTIGTTIYEREAVLSTVTLVNTADGVDVVVTVSWNDGQGSHEVRHQTQLTYWNK